MLEYREKYPACPHVISLLLDIYEQSNTTEDLKLAVKVKLQKKKFFLK